MVALCKVWRFRQGNAHCWRTGGITLHIRKLDGHNSHHIVEATFKAFARALRQATEVDPRRQGMIASSKGVLTQQ